MLRLILCAYALFLPFAANATILPPNDLHLEDDLQSRSNISKEKFQEINQKIKDIYGPIAEAHGGKLVINEFWILPTVNASAIRAFNVWFVNMFGGLARRPEVTPDGYALVVCHELGHHLAGYPTAPRFGILLKWAANEGQSDYFATQACARKIWENDLEENAEAAQHIDAQGKALCDAHWNSVNDQNLCYRTLLAGKSLATLLGTLRKGATAPSFDTPDQSVVDKTYNAHPEGQCRLDTYVAGALCDVEFDQDIIPGVAPTESATKLDMEAQAAQYSCMRRDNYTAPVVRPSCWFAPLAN